MPHAHRRHTQRRTHVLLASLLIAAPFLATGCDTKAPGVIATTPADQTYTVRGRVMALPDPATNAALQIHHEEIPTFVGKDGTVKGMKEMIMEFAWVAPGVLPEKLAAGDAVEMTFEVRWNASPRTLVTALTKLPDSSPLNLKPTTEGE